MKIKYMTQEALDIYKSNPKEMQKYIIENSDLNWVENVFPSNFLKESKIEAEGLEFIINQSYSTDDLDFFNAKMLHQSLSGLNETQASNESLWIGLTLSYGYEYLQKRWGVEGTKFKYRWNFYQKGKRGMIHHGLARLWWLTRMTYDSDREDPYELTHYAFHHQSFLMKLAYRNYSNSPRIVNAILSAFIIAEQEGLEITYGHTVDLYKEVSLLGSIAIIDAYSKDELQTIVLDKIRKIVNDLN